MTTTFFQVLSAFAQVVEVEVHRTARKHTLDVLGLDRKHLLQPRRRGLELAARVELVGEGHQGRDVLRVRLVLGHQARHLGLIDGRRGTGGGQQPGLLPPSRATVRG